MFIYIYIYISINILLFVDFLKAFDSLHRGKMEQILLTNTPAQVESLLHSLEQTAGKIGLHVNVDKR